MLNIFLILFLYFSSLYSSISSNKFSNIYDSKLFLAFFKNINFGDEDFDLDFKKIQDLSYIKEDEMKISLRESDFFDIKDKIINTEFSSKGRQETIDFIMKNLSSSFFKDTDKQKNINLIFKKKGFFKKASRLAGKVFLNKYFLSALTGIAGGVIGREISDRKFNKVFEKEKNIIDKDGFSFFNINKNGKRVFLEDEFLSKEGKDFYKYKNKKQELPLYEETEKVESEKRYLEEEVVTKNNIYETFDINFKDIFEQKFKEIEDRFMNIHRAYLNSLKNVYSKIKDKGRYSRIIRDYENVFGGLAIGSEKNIISSLRSFHNATREFIVNCLKNIDFENFEKIKNYVLSFIENDFNQVEENSFKVNPNVLSKYYSDFRGRGIKNYNAFREIFFNFFNSLEQDIVHYNNIILEIQKNEKEGLEEEDLKRKQEMVNRFFEINFKDVFERKFNEVENRFMQIENYFLDSLKNAYFKVKKSGDIQKYKEIMTIYDNVFEGKAFASKDKVVSRVKKFREITVEFIVNCLKNIDFENSDKIKKYILNFIENDFIVVNSEIFYSDIRDFYYIKDGILNVTNRYDAFRDNFFNFFDSIKKDAEALENFSKGSFWERFISDGGMKYFDF